MFCKVAFDIALDKEFDYSVPEHLRELAQKGARVRAPFGFRETTGVITDVFSSSDSSFKLKDIADVFNETPPFSGEMFALADFIKAKWGGAKGQLLFSLLPVNPYPDFSCAAQNISLPEISEKLFIKKNETENLKKPVVLTGEGAGKTETALYRAAETFKNGGTVLLLTPDIIQAESAARLIKNKFSFSPFVWHSRILQSERRKIISSLYAGPSFIVGTRSAALLPFKKLDLTVMLDEENPDYKQEENKPFFHARDVMFFRARSFGGRLLFVTPTPSLELCRLVKNNEAEEVFFPSEDGLFYRVDAAPLRGTKYKTISDKLASAAQDAFNKKQKILFVLDKRASAPFYECLNCGVKAVCKKCAAPLTVHGEGEEKILKCSKCSAQEEAQRVCPACGNSIFRERETGAGGALKDIKKLLPGVNLIQFNASADEQKILEELKKDNAVVLGTAMAAGALQGKETFGLVAFLDADSSLSTADFRASEHLAQTLFRAKNLLADKTSAMIIQSSEHSSALFNAVVHGDYSAFVKEELEFREAFALPPYIGLVKVLFSAKTKEEILTFASALNKEIKGKFENIEILGPVHSGKKSDKLKKEYFLFKLNTPSDLIEFLEGRKLPKNIKQKISADPYNFF